MRLAACPRALACSRSAAMDNILGDERRRRQARRSAAAAGGGPGSGGRSARTARPTTSCAPRTRSCSTSRSSTFPDRSAAPGKKRLFRLTRQQLDQRPQSLLPAALRHERARSAAARPAADQLRVRRQPELQRRQLHAAHAMGRQSSRPSVKAAPGERRSTAQRKATAGVPGRARAQRSCSARFAAWSTTPA